MYDFRGQALVTSILIGSFGDMKSTGLSFLSNAVWLLLLVVVSVLGGCCPDTYVENNDLTDLLRTQPISTFVDSSGNYLQLILNDTSYNLYPSPYDPYCETHVPETDLIAHGHHEGELVYYNQFSGSIHLFDLTLNSVYPSFYGNSMTIQNFDYNNCWYINHLDSSGQKNWELAIDRYYGIVLFSKRDEYRWERVLEW